jgi:hypothetical protein
VYFSCCPYCKWTHHIQTDHDPGIDCQILLLWVGAAHISYLYAPSLSFDIFHKWNINNECSTSCVRSGHVMVFLIVFCVLVCTRTVLFVSMIEECRSFVCNKEDHTLQYVVLSNEVGLSLFL